MQNEKEIISAIAAYLQGTCRDASNEKTIFLNFGSLNPGHYTFEGFCKELSTEIHAAIAPLLEAEQPDWKNAPLEARLKEYFEGLPKEISRELQHDDTPF